ncbi:hypothetical protein Bbelb_257580 [Branchiostoma belcheri]|nr:hypothetical protein Bbelb_257580 [Branchiostoma belcheri]
MEVIKGIVWTVLFAGFVVLAVQYWLDRKGYNFEHKAIAAITREYIDADRETAMKAIVAHLRELNPNGLLPDEDLQWLYVDTTEHVGPMCLLHLSLTEYLAFVGTDLDFERSPTKYDDEINKDGFTDIPSNYVSNRQFVDKAPPNKFGRLLTDLCIQADLRILNGRVPGDLQDSVCQYLKHYIPKPNSSLELNWHGWANTSETVIEGGGVQTRVKHDIEFTLNLKPGDTAWVLTSDDHLVNWSMDTWMIEYGRGFTPMPIASSVLNAALYTRDWPTLKFLLNLYYKGLVREFMFHSSIVQDFLEEMHHLQPFLQ